MQGSEEYKGVPHEELPCVRSQFWEALKIAEESGLEPTVVTEEEINGRLNRMRAYYAAMTPEKRKENQGFGIGHGLLDESDYWQIQDKAKKINMPIPTLEDFGKEVDVEPNYDCNTGKGFTETTDIPIINPLGWESQEAYENERIPWIEYCDRRARSDCDYRIFAPKRWERCKHERYMLSDTKNGDRIWMQTGPHAYKNATVIENNGGEYVVVNVDGMDNTTSIYTYNAAMQEREERPNNTTL